MHEIQEGDAEDMKLAVESAQRAFESGVWADASPKERGRVLLKAAQLLRDRIDEIVTIEVLSTGRAIRYGI